jgi:hypothetical protein
MRAHVAVSQHRRSVLAARAREMRHSPTASEEALFGAVRGRQLGVALSSPGAATRWPLRGGLLRGRRALGRRSRRPLARRPPCGRRAPRSGAMARRVSRAQARSAARVRSKWPMRSLKPAANGLRTHGRSFRRSTATRRTSLRLCGSIASHCAPIRQSLVPKLTLAHQAHPVRPFPHHRQRAFLSCVHRTKCWQRRQKTRR